MFDKSNFQFDSNIKGNNNVVDNDMNVDINMNSTNGMKKMGMPCSPVQEKCIHKTIVHEVPHVCPIHTRIINHHVFKHVYRPQYTCSEENVVSNVQCGSCSQFQ